MAITKTGTETGTGIGMNNNNDDVMILRMVFCIAFGIYVVSLVTLGRCSITHSWLFTHLTALQPTSESIASIRHILSSSKSASSSSTSSHRHRGRQSSNTTASHGNQHQQQQQHQFHSNNNQPQPQPQQRGRGNSSSRQRRNRSNHNNRIEHETDSQYSVRNSYNANCPTLLSTPQHRLQEQLSILEFTTAKIQPGVIASIQYRRLLRRRNRTATTAATSTSNANNDNVNDNGIQDHNNTNSSSQRSSSDDKEAFILWKYLETAVLSCISCVVILIIRWVSHIRYCRSFAATLLEALTMGSNHDGTTSFRNINNNNHYTQQQRETLQQGWNYINSTVESNGARWWLMLFILVTILTWFHLAFMANRTSSTTTGIAYYYSYSPFSYFCGIIVAYFVWRHVGTKEHSPDYDDNNNIPSYNNNNDAIAWYTIDDALDELASRSLLLVRILGWKMDGLLLWNVFRRSLRIFVALFCGCFGFVLSDPIWTFQHAMLYRLYVGSGNDIQYNQKGIRNSSSRWRNSQSKRVWCMETLWKLTVLVALITPVANFAYYHYCRKTTSFNSHGNNEGDNNIVMRTIPGIYDENGFETNGSQLLMLHISYILLLCILARRFQQDYLLSALPVAVSILQQQNNYSITSTSNDNIHVQQQQQQQRTSNNTNNNFVRNQNHVYGPNVHENNDGNGNGNDDEEDDIYQLLTYPFLLRIETILRNGTKLVCVPLLLTVLFGVNHISDFQRGPTTYPSAYGGPWLATDSVNRWHRYRTLSQISKFLVLPTSTKNGEDGDKSVAEGQTSILSSSAYESLYALLASEDAVVENSEQGLSCPSNSNFLKRWFMSLGAHQTEYGSYSSLDSKCQYQNSGTKTSDMRHHSIKTTTVTSIDLKMIAMQRLNKTVPSALRKLQKLAKESLKDNNIRACITGGGPPQGDPNSVTRADEQQREQLYLLAQEKVNATKQELYEVFDALSHHPLITAETVFTLSRFVEMTLCIFWTILLIPILVLSHASLQRQRRAILQLNTSAFHANPQDADD